MRDASGSGNHAPDTLHQMRATNLIDGNYGFGYCGGWLGDSNWQLVCDNKHVQRVLRWPETKSNSAKKEQKS